MSKKKLYIFDTTVRDGAQTQGVDFSIDEKVKLTEALDNLGVDYIEGGWPGANQTDTEFFQKKIKCINSKLTAFGINEIETEIKKLATLITGYEKIGID